MSETKCTFQYEVTRDGRVFSLSSNWRGYGIRELQQTANSYGYPSVRIIIEGKRKRICVYKLVAWAYLPPRPSSKHELRHLDGDKNNSNDYNLAWGTRKDNAADRDIHGHTSRGLKHSQAIKSSRHGEAVRYYHLMKKAAKAEGKD
jgi:hypothetical protein